MAHRFPSRFLVASLLVAALGSAARAGGGAHPYFDDRGALTWYASLQEATRSAKTEGKVVLLEYGRKRCGQCRAFCSQVLPDPAVRRRLAKVAVGLVVDCDAPEADAEAILRQNLPDADLLPIVGLVRPDGRWITGFCGPISTEAFLAHVAAAERAVAACGAPAVKPAAATKPVAPKSPVMETVATTAPSAPAADRIAKAHDAVRRGAWGEAMRLCREAGPGDARMAELRQEAKAWAEGRLGDAVTALRAHRYDEALQACATVREAMRGEPEAVDASRGARAVLLAREVSLLDPKGSTVVRARKSAAEELKGTRWETVFG